MAFTKTETAHIEDAMAEFLAKHRPPEKLRAKLDIAYRIKGQSVIIYEQRPIWDDSSEIIEEPVAKATYVRRESRWRVYWQRADMKWHYYYPQTEALFFEEFLALVEDDAEACFWG